MLHFYSVALPAPMTLKYLVSCTFHPVQAPDFPQTFSTDINANASNSLGPLGQNMTSLTFNHMAERIYLYAQNWK